MIHRPPTGTRDLLPADVARKQAVEGLLVDVFRRWGYARIIPPTLERLQTLTAGGAIDPDRVLQVRDPEGTLLGLRPELTASIVRAVASRMGHVPRPVRLFYYGSVFQASRQEQERFQAGIELIGAADWLADAEVLVVLGSCLRALGIPEWTLLLGDAALTESLLAVLSPTAQGPVKLALAHLDRVALETLPLSERDRHWALTLFDLRGDPERVWSQLHSLMLVGAAQERVKFLQQICGVMAQQGIQVVVDLSLVQAFEYYTGLIFRAVVKGEVVGSGGRYDDLHALYSPSHLHQPGIGFCLYLEPLLRQLPLDADPTSSDYLVVPQDPRTAATALGVISTWPDPETRFTLEILGRSHDEAVDYARALGIPEILWVQADGSYHTSPVG